VIGLIAVGIWLVMIIGWVMNIVNIALHHEVVNGMFILRCIGILFAPMGSILGFM
jgi:hypothetical protein